MNAAVETETIQRAVAALQPSTRGVTVGSEIRVGPDSTDEDAVWVYVHVPDERIDEFYEEWDELRAEIRRRVRETLGDPEAFVYVRMRATSELQSA